jgi:uncharacterized protein (DUF1330 family)
MAGTFIDPDREAFRQFAKLEVKGPVQMLNLLKLKEHASYEDGRGGTGEEAYRAYSKASAPFFGEVGGKIVWRGKPLSTLIGPADERWDLGFIAEYPSKDAFLSMVKNEGYQAIIFHRQAAVATSRLTCFGKSEGDGLFR